MSQEKIKSLMDKINLLMNVFMKDGLEKVSQLEKDLLKEQVHSLLEEVENLELKSSRYTETPPLKEVQAKAEVEAKPAPVVEPASVTEPAKVEEASVQKVEVPVEPVEEVKPLIQDESDSEVSGEERVFSTEKPHRSLKSVIDLNKSFILKAELFGNNNNLYNEFITSLSVIESEEESFRILEAKKDEMNWDEEEKAYQLLERAVEKRFLPLLHQ